MGKTGWFIFSLVGSIFLCLSPYGYADISLDQAVYGALCGVVSGTCVYFCTKDE